MRVSSSSPESILASSSPTSSTASASSTVSRTFSGPSSSSWHAFLYRLAIVSWRAVVSSGARRTSRLRLFPRSQVFCFVNVSSKPLSVRRRPTDRLGRDSHPRHLGRRVTGSDTRVDCSPGDPPGRFAKFRSAVPSSTAEPTYLFGALVVVVKCDLPTYPDGATGDNGPPPARSRNPGSHRGSTNDAGGGRLSGRDVSRLQNFRHSAVTSTCCIRSPALISTTAIWHQDSWVSRPYKSPSSSQTRL